MNIFKSFTFFGLIFDRADRKQQLDLSYKKTGIQILSFFGNNTISVSEVLSLKDLMNTIISIDKNANQKLKQAAERKEQEIEKINHKKDSLSKQIQTYADEHLKSFEESEKLAAQDSILAIKNTSDAEKNRIQDIFEKNRSQWAEDMVKRILNA